MYIIVNVASLIVSQAVAGKVMQFFRIFLECVFNINNLYLREQIKHLVTTAVGTYCKSLNHFIIP